MSGLRKSTKADWILSSTEKRSTFDMTNFFNHRALVSQRSSGYRNTAYALAELIDNAFDATADEVRVIMLERRDESNRRYIDEILICDNGYGMPASELQFCLQFGGGVNLDIDEIIRERKKGKFGYGLPNASLSQCPCVHVYAWREPDCFRRVYLDVDELTEMQSVEIPETSEVTLPTFYKDVGAVIKPATGVIVSWRRCDRLMNTRASTIIEKSEELLGSLFRYMIAEGKFIRLLAYEYNPRKNNFVKSRENVVAPNDPLFLLPNTVIAKHLYLVANPGPGSTEQQLDIAKHYMPFSVSETECLATNETVEDHCFTYKFEWKGRIYRFPIRTSVAKIDIQKPGIREGGSTKVGGFYGKKESITFVRADREIANGSFGGFYKATEPRNRWWTIEVRFDADADDLLGVHNNKQGIEFHYTKEFDPSEEWDKHTASLQQAREKLWFELTKKIEQARKAAWKIVLKHHKEWDLTHVEPGEEGEAGKIPEGTKTTTSIVAQVDGKRERQFSDEEREALLRRLREKYPSLDEDDIKKAIDKYDYALARGCVLYHSSESESLWSLTTVYDFLIVLINTEHEFYKNVISPLRMHRFEAALAAIELFISSLAWEEVEHFGTSPQKDTIELYRSYVGLHLNRYIRELNITERDFLKLITDEEEA